MMMFAAFYAPADTGDGGLRVLSLGQVGGDVRKLQIELDKKGYNLKPYDGIYGLRTFEAVMDFQQRNGLKPTGAVNNETRAALGKKESSGTIAARTGGTRPPGMQVSRGISREDRIMLARIIHGEARGEGFEGQIAVAAVVLNRAESGQFPDSINGVIFEKGAFDAVSDGQIWYDPDDKALKAAELALAGYDPTGGALYYWNPETATSKWVWSRPVVKQIGGHVFAH
ncbi:MAG: spore cortex-lytic enzyme [Firmicutes bacterium HGW-Firmicutes-14]|nr:MAG: spore cortex-lytic enzyme [Firmicutes bacterium HGW-Firmicutes-14]